MSLLQHANAFLGPKTYVIDMSLNKSSLNVIYVQIMYHITRDVIEYFPFLLLVVVVYKVEHRLIIGGPSH